MKVLLGIDDSSFSDTVVQAIAKQLKREAIEILVLHVLEPTVAEAVPEMSAGYAPELEDEKQPAQVMVRRIADKLRVIGFKAETSVEIGDPEVRILEVAAAWPADLVVVGSHGHTGIRDLLLGSVSESVARHAKCSVEIVRAQ
jgi:nucleotide-binding universal stress UspA family protein